MTVIAKGKIGKLPMSLQLSDGVLSGDSLAVSLVRRAIANDIDVSIPGVIGGPASMEDDSIALATFLFVLDNATIKTDLIPDDLPEGTIA